MSIDEEQFKHLMGDFASGVTIVTTEQDNQIRGLTVSAFASVSKQPPLVLVNIEKQARSDEFLRRGAGFSINILTADQQELCMKFAQPGLSMEERLSGVEHEPSPSDGVIFPDSLAWMACQQRECHDAGDHRIYVGEVIETNRNPGAGEPLLYFRGEFPSLTPLP